MTKLKKRSRSAVKGKTMFPVIENDGLPPLKKLSMDEYLSFITGNIRLFPDLLRTNNLAKWKKQIVPARFVLG